MQMNPIGNNPVKRPSALTLTQQPKDTRVAVVKWPHGVEEVSDHARALVGSLHSLLVGCVRVSDCVDDVALGDFGDLGHHVADLWRGCYHFDGIGACHIVCAVTVEDVLEGLGCAQDFCFVDAVAARADEWAFSVGA
jgi:hypothetical protein